MNSPRISRTETRSSFLSNIPHRIRNWLSVAVLKRVARKRRFVAALVAALGARVQEIGVVLALDAEKSFAARPVLVTGSVRRKTTPVAVDPLHGVVKLPELDVEDARRFEFTALAARANALRNRDLALGAKNPAQRLEIADARQAAVALGHRFRFQFGQRRRRRWWT